VVPKNTAPRRNSASRLLKHTINLILIVQFQHFRCRIGFNTFSIQEETKGAGLHSLSLSIRLKDLLHLGGLFNLEKSLFASLQKVPNKKNRKKGEGVHLETTSDTPRQDPLIQHNDLSTETMGLRQLIERLVTSHRYSMHQMEAVVPGRTTTFLDEQRGPCYVLLRSRVFKDEVK
jgi:hypothetical protein